MVALSAIELGDDADPQTGPASMTLVDGGFSEVESSGSWEAMTSCSRAVSSTVRAMGPGVSREEAMAMTPKRETVP